jgi:hypothetical protein
LLALTLLLLPLLLLLVPPPLPSADKIGRDAAELLPVVCCHLDVSPGKLDVTPTSLDV